MHAFHHLSTSFPSAQPCRPWNCAFGFSTPFLKQTFLHNLDLNAAQGSGYLAMTDSPQALPSPSSPTAVDSGLQDMGEMIAKDDESVASELSFSQINIARFEYHIVYHPAYQVPTLYFNGFDKGGFCAQWHMLRHITLANRLQAHGA